MHREPFLLPAAVLGAAILYAHFYYFELPWLIFPACLAGLAVLLALTRPTARLLRWTAVCSLFAVLGIATQVVHRQGHRPKLNVQDGDTALLSGCVIAPTAFSPDREQFTLALGHRASAKVTVGLKNRQRFPLAYGQRVEVAAKVRYPRNFQNPESFDYVGYLASQHIYWLGSVSDPSDIHILAGQCGARPLAWLYAVRTWALDRLEQLYPGDPHSAGLLQATLLGETAGVERRWTNDFRVTGTYHALVISGQHVSVLAISILLILRLLQFRRVPSLVLATTVCWLYALISGFSSPVVRAAGGFTLYLATSYVFRKGRVLNVLAVVGVVYLLLDPDQLFDPSFQLSFLSAAAIGAFAIPLMQRFTEPLRAAVKRFGQIAYDPLIEDRAAAWRVELRLVAETVAVWTRLRLSRAQWAVEKAVRIGLFAGEAVIISACVQFGLALPMVSYFHRLSITGLSANILVIPLLSLVVPLGFASIVTGWHVLALVTATLLRWSEAVATWHSKLEPAWRIGAVPLWLALSFSISLIGLAVAARHGRRSILPAWGGAMVLFAVLCWQPWKPVVKNGTLELTAIDVSQGDSLLVVFPNGETMLVDAGGFPGMERMTRKPQMDMGEDVVSPYLWSRRITHLDYAVLTHGHSDHMAGLPAILDNFRPKVLWTGAEPETAEWKQVELRAAADKVPIVHLHRGCTEFLIGGVRVRALAPSADYVSGEKAVNNDSLVLEASFGRQRILLTGDAEKPVEDDLVNSGALESATLLKVGHHGSRTSSSEEFLDQVRPRFAFISDGYNNQFHHPHTVVLDRLAEHHAAVFRTDQHGLLTFRTDGEKVEIETYR